MKILKSEFHNQQWNGKEVKSLPLSLLWPSVPKAAFFKKKPFYGPVKNDIQQNGMKFPIIVVKSSYEELKAQKKRFTKGMRELPSPDTFFGYTVWGGSNRYRIAEDLGCSHIDCVLYDNFDQARKDQRFHRDEFKQFYT